MLENIAFFELKERENCNFQHWKEGEGVASYADFLWARQRLRDEPKESLRRRLGKGRTC